MTTGDSCAKPNNNTVCQTKSELIHLKPSSNRRNVMILSDEASPAYPYPPASAWVAPYPSYTTMPFSGSGYSYPGSGLGR